TVDRHGGLALPLAPRWHQFIQAARRSFFRFSSARFSVAFAVGQVPWRHAESAPAARSVRRDRAKRARTLLPRSGGTDRETSGSGRRGIGARSAPPVHRRRRTWPP